MCLDDIETAFIHIALFHEGGEAKFDGPHDKQYSTISVGLLIKNISIVVRVG